MSKESTPDRNALARRVEASLQKAEGIVSGLRKANTRLLVAGMASSAAATLVAGITAAQGPVVGTGIEGWRVACIVAAVFAAASTASTGLNQQLKISDRLAKGTQCVGRLKSLDIVIATDSRGREEIVKEYEEIAKTYPELIS
jgi:ABC-type uncharacterized transport system substrate-binding protein